MIPFDVDPSWYERYWLHDSVPRKPGMARKDERFLIPFQVDPSWYERYWWQAPAPRRPGIFAFFRRILSQQRLIRRQDVRADHQIPHSPLEFRPNCECCNKDLPPESLDARICSFECTFCRDCAETTLHGRCPNCGGGFVPRPIRPAEKLARFPASSKRVLKPEGCAVAPA
jgi:uncharacterized protein